MKSSFTFITVKRALSLVALCAFFTMASAQDCSEILSKATSYYDAGQFKQCIETAQTCLDQGDEADQWKSLRVLTMAYLASDQNEDARETAIALLEINPTYKPSRLTDPQDYVKLINSIEVIPKFSLGLGIPLGATWTYPNVSEAYFTTEQTKTYTGKLGFSIGVSSSYFITNAQSIEIGINLTTKRYDLDHSIENWNLTANENLAYINIPVLWRYNYDIKTRIKPFLQLGAYGGLLAFGDNSFYATYVPDGTGYTLEHMNSTPRRNTVDYGLVGGLGISYKLNNGFLDAYFCVNRSFNNITRPDARYDFNELQYSYFYIDDNMTLSTATVGIGYRQVLNYKVVK